MKIKIMALLTIPYLIIAGSKPLINEISPIQLKGNDLYVDVKYNLESLEKLLMQTETVLANVPAFLQEDEAYQFALPFYPLSGRSFPEEQWKTALKRYVENEIEKKKCEFLFANLKHELTTFEEKVIPIWTSFLPEREYTSIKSKVYFTAFQAFDAINIHDNIVINALHPKFHGSTDYLLNVLTHELFHSGYGSCSPYRQERLPEEKLYYLLETLHNEGLTTYVAMQAGEQYPASKIREYAVLKDEDQIKKMRLNLNAFFSEIDSMTTDQVKKKAWFLGVQLRGFYVVGADMSRKIEIEKGREILAETVAKGPIHFYELYNSLAKEEEKLHPFDLLKHLSPADELQGAILSQDSTTIDQVKRRIIGNKANIPQSELEVFYRLGYRLLRGKKQLDLAEVVFKLLLELADNPTFAYAYLGEIEIGRGHKTQAREYLSHSLALDEHNPLALTLMNSID